MKPSYRVIKTSRNDKGFYQEALQGYFETFASAGEYALKMWQEEKQSTMYVCKVVGVVSPPDTPKFVSQLTESMED